MKYATIGFAPLKDSGKTSLQKASIPEATLQASEPPSFMEQYGLPIYLLICGLIALVVIYPLLSMKWDVNKTEDQNAFIITFAVYAFICIAVYFLWVQPALGSQDIDLSDFEFHSVITFVGAITGTFALARASSAKSSAVPKKTLKVAAKDDSEAALVAKLAAVLKERDSETAANLLD